MGRSINGRSMRIELIHIYYFYFDINIAHINIMILPYITSEAIIILFTLYLITFLFTRKLRYTWDIFTRIVSTINSIQCIMSVFHSLSDSKYYDLNYTGTLDFQNSLLWFSTYLFIDGVFIVFHSKRITTSDVTSVLHHFVGSYGIYLIASQRQGLGLGIYFALTEISTPLLNLSWVYYTNGIKNKLVFLSFYIVFTSSRIITIPLLLNYINYNIDKINTLETVNYGMVYGGSYTLICLNLLWFVMLTTKVKSMIYTAGKIKKT